MKFHSRPRVQRPQNDKLWRVACTFFAHKRRLFARTFTRVRVRERLNSIRKYWYDKLKKRRKEKSPTDQKQQPVWLTMLMMATAAATTNRRKMKQERCNDEETTGKYFFFSQPHTSKTGIILFRNERKRNETITTAPRSWTRSRARPQTHISMLLLWFEMLTETHRERCA